MNPVLHVGNMPARLLSPCRLQSSVFPHPHIRVSNKHLSTAHEVINEDNPSGRLSIW